MGRAGAPDGLSPLDFASPLVIFAAVEFKQALGETIEAILVLA
jgi:hypothetical protein